MGAISHFCNHIFTVDASVEKLKKKKKKENIRSEEHQKPYLEPWQSVCVTLRLVEVAMAISRRLGVLLLYF